MVMIFGWLSATGRLSFADEALLATGVGHLSRRQELNRNRSIQLGVIGLVHHAHATLADLLEDSVMRNCAADHDVACLLMSGNLLKCKGIGRLEATTSRCYEFTNPHLIRV
jgi:hypothetical protein